MKFREEELRCFVVRGLYWRTWLTTAANASLTVIFLQQQQQQNQCMMSSMEELAVIFFQPGILRNRPPWLAVARFSFSRYGPLTPSSIPIGILAWAVYFALEDAKVWVKSILMQRRSVNFRDTQIINGGFTMRAFPLLFAWQPWASVSFKCKSLTSHVIWQQYSRLYEQFLYIYAICVISRSYFH